MDHRIRFLISRIARNRCFQHSDVRLRLVRGMQIRSAPGNPNLHTFIMISTAAELAVALVADLPPEVRTIVEAHFFDGESVFKIQRQRKMKRRDLKATIEAALGNMRVALRSRGVRAVGDVI